MALKTTINTITPRAIPIVDDADINAENPFP